jgi:hypothetical protein
MDVISKNISNPDVCEDPNKKIDLSKYPTDLRTDDITPFLCEVLKGARDDSVDPVLRPGFDEFNIDPWVQSLTSLHDVGDPRLSMGELMTKTIDKYLPLLRVKLDLLQGGCTLENEEVCDPDGKVLYNVKEKCGADVDPTEEITLDNLKKFTTDLWNQKVQKTANDFIYFIKNTYVDNSWKVELITLSDGDLKKIKYGRGIPIFYVKASIFDVARNKQMVNYHKYYFDSREIVSKGLKIKLTLLDPKFLRENYDDDALMDGLSGPIWPDKI